MTMTGNRNAKIASDGTFDLAMGFRQCTVHSRAGNGMKCYWLLNGQAVAHCVEARRHKPEGRGIGGMKTDAIIWRITLTRLFRKCDVDEV
jgi:hypothetical protein